MFGFYYFDAWHGCGVRGGRRRDEDYEQLHNGAKALGFSHNGRVGAEPGRWG